MPNTIGVSAAHVKAYAPQDRHFRNKKRARVTIGERLRELRGEKSQRAIARDSGLDGGTVSRIERGELDPTVSTLEKLARALGVPVARFFDEGAVPGVSPLVEPMLGATVGDLAQAQGALLEAVRMIVDALVRSDSIAQPDREQLTRLQDRLSQRESA